MAACAPQCCELPPTPSIYLRAADAVSSFVPKCGFAPFGGISPTKRYLSKVTSYSQEGTETSTTATHAPTPDTEDDPDTFELASTSGLSVTESGSCTTTETYDPAPLAVCDPEVEPACDHSLEIVGETVRETTITQSAEGGRVISGFCVPSLPGNYTNIAHTTTVTTDCETGDPSPESEGIICTPSPAHIVFNTDNDGGVINEGGTVRTTTESTTPATPSDTIGTPPNHTDRTAAGGMTRVTTETLSGEFTDEAWRDLSLLRAAACGYGDFYFYTGEGDDTPVWSVYLSPGGTSLAVNVTTWEIVHGPSLTGYLKIWLDLIKDDNGTITTTPLAPYVWNAAYPGPEDIHGGGGVGTPDAFPAVGGTSIDWRVRIKKWSVVQAYEPPDDGSANGYPVAA